MNGDWYYSPDYRQPCQVIESQTLWDERTCRVWLPGNDSVVCVPASRLASFDNLYVEAILNSVEVDRSVDKVIARLQEQVRDHRLNLLQKEESAWNEEHKRKAQVYPEMVPLIIIRVEKYHHE